MIEQQKDPVMGKYASYVRTESEHKIDSDIVRIDIYKVKCDKSGRIIVGRIKITKRRNGDIECGGHIPRELVPEGPLIE